MASLPAIKTQSSLSPKQIKYREKLLELIVKGVPIWQIALKMAQGDERKARGINTKIRRLVYRDAYIRERLAEIAAGTNMVNLVPSVEAVGRRAQRGRIDAAKLIWEQTGFHVPHSRRDVQHSGEVQVTFSAMPRPALTEETPVDADVVEE